MQNQGNSPSSRSNLSFAGILLACFAAAVLGLVATGGVARAEPETRPSTRAATDKEAILIAKQRLGESLMTYRLNPDPGRLLPMLGYLEATAGDPDFDHGSALMSQFVGGVLRQHPDALGPTLAAAREKGTPVYLIALRGVQLSLIESSEKLLNAEAEHSPQLAKPIRELARRPAADVLKAPIRSPSDLDMLWAHFLATGDAAAVDRICETFAYDIGTPLAGATRPAATTRPRPNLTKLMIQKAAEWSVDSNARQFKEAFDAVEHLASASPEQAVADTCKGIVAKIRADSAVPTK